MTYTVHTQHGEGRTVRTAQFSNYEEALAHAKSTNPEVDGSMAPNVDEAFSDLATYEKGLYWMGNKYAVITKEAAQ